LDSLNIAPATQQDLFSPDYQQMRHGRPNVKAAGLRCGRFSPQVGAMSDDIHRAPPGVPKAPPGPTVIPRAAASLLVVRREAEGPRLLMARRGAGHRFMPNVLVFPGGAVDPSDFGAAVGTPLRAEVQARLERSAAPGLAAALGMAAARELEEEVGLSLGNPPQLHGLDFFARAITPPDRAMRFDAYFFAVDAALVRGEPVGSAELEDPAWYSMEAALAAPLALATRAVLAQFAQWLARPVHGGPVPVLRERAWVEE
jgi:8-oxo-dGTP pyrophosphatase MutT (NUDIX family)